MKVHDLALRADYEIASKEHEYFFELDVSFSYTHPNILVIKGHLMMAYFTKSHFVPIKLTTTI